MPSSLSWLDFSEADQRRAREIVQLFSQRESRDELGIGTIRDVFSNLLFPGVSVIQTRARYYLFIPWLLQTGARRGHKGAALVAWLNREERKLIETLRKGGDLAGLIGVEAGIALKTLPSTVYWGGLSTYGITRWPGTIEQVANARARHTAAEEALTEMVDRTRDAWDPEIPPPPVGFPALDSIDFSMSPDEEGWLRERILATTEGSLLHWLVLNGARPSVLQLDESTNWPWTEPASAGAPAPVARALQHAEQFSLAMHGAALLYNLMLAKKMKELDSDFDVTDYIDMLDAWQVRVADSQLANWDLNDFWALVAERHPGSLVRTRQFVDQWVALVRSGPLAAPERMTAACALVEHRERQQKGARARLVNEKLLRQWNGASGTSRLGYRWGQVVRMLSDLNQEQPSDA